MLLLGTSKQKGLPNVHPESTISLLGCGVKPELLEIVAIRGIGRVRARRRYDAGCTTPESRVEAGEQRIGEIIGPRVARNVIREVESGGKV